MEELNNIIVEIQVIAKRGRGRPFKIKVPVDDAIPVQIKVRKHRGPKPSQTGSVLVPEYFNWYYRISQMCQMW